MIQGIAFLEDYYAAIIHNENLDLSKYMNNENLIQYSNIKVKTGSYPIDTARINSVEYRMIEESRYDNYSFYEMNIKVTLDYGGGFSENQQFLIIKNEDGFDIADWYSPGVGQTGFLDDIRDEKGNIKDPTIWNNEDWVKEIFAR